MADTFKLNCWKGDYHSINRDLTSVDWESLFSGKNVEEMWSIFKEKLLTACSTRIPTRNTEQQKLNKKNWMTEATIKQIRKREVAWHKYKRVSSTQIY